MRLTDLAARGGVAVRTLRGAGDRPLASGVCRVRGATVGGLASQATPIAAQDRGAGRARCAACAATGSRRATCRRPCARAAIAAAIRGGVDTRRARLLSLRPSEPRGTRKLRSPSERRTRPGPCAPHTRGRRQHRPRSLGSAAGPRRGSRARARPRGSATAAVRALVGAIASGAPGRRVLRFDARTPSGRRRDVHRHATASPSRAPRHAPRRSRARKRRGEPHRDAHRLRLRLRAHLRRGRHRRAAGRRLARQRRAGPRHDAAGDARRDDLPHAARARAARARARGRRHAVRLLPGLARGRACAAPIRLREGGRRARGEARGRRRDGRRRSSASSRPRSR